MSEDVNKNTGYSKIKNILHNGEYDSLRGHIRKAGLKYGTVQGRLAKNMSLEEALSKPPGKSGTRYNGNPPPKPPLQKEQHGLSDSSEYNIYLKMISRCHNEKDLGYSYYGERGIKVCDRWRNSFRHFISDMGFRPSKRHSIDRIDNNKGYSPDNCRWATKTEQSNNRRSNRNVVYNGEKLTATELANKLGVGSEYIYTRLNNSVSVDDIVEMAKKYRSSFYNYKGKLKTLTGHALEHGLSHDTLKNRLAKGLTIEQAIESPRRPGVFLTKRKDG